MTDADRQLRWLARGAERAQAIHSDRARHTHAVWEAVREGLELVEQTEDQEKRWLSSGTRCSLAALQGMNTQEALELEIEQLMAAMGTQPTRVDRGPATGDHAYMMDVLDWLRFCVSKNDPDNRLGKAAAALMKGAGPETVSKIMGRKVSRQTAADMRDVRIPRAILKGLRESYGIVPGDGITFIEAVS